jgi:hypothetical protein
MKPDWFLRGLTATMALSSIVSFEPAPFDVALAGMSCAALVFGRVSFQKQHEVPLAFIVLFIIANLVSVANASDVTRAIWYAAVTIYLAASMFLFMGVIGRYREVAFEALMKGYVFAGLLSTSLALSAYFGLIPFQDTMLLYGRPKGMFKDPNVFGPYLIPMCLYALVKVETHVSSLARGGYLGVFVLGTAGVFFSFSRACWLSYLVAVATYAGLRIVSEPSSQRRLKWIVRAAAVASIAVVLLGVSLLNDRVSKMLTLRMGKSGLQQYDRLRFETQRVALLVARENVIGLGPGQSENEFLYATHSSYIRLLVENGVLGFASFYILIVLSAVRAVRGAWKFETQLWRIYACVAAGSIISLVLNSTVIDTVHWRHSWLFLGLAWTSFYAPTLSRVPQSLSARPRLSPILR